MLHATGRIAEIRQIYSAADYAQSQAELFAGVIQAFCMRFHALLLCVQHRVPSVALSYDPKVHSLAAEAGIPCIDLSDDEDLSVRSVTQPTMPSPQYYAELDASVRRSLIDLQSAVEPLL